MILNWFLINFVLYFIVYHVKENGWVDISVDDCKDLHYKYQDEKKAQA